MSKSTTHTPIGASMLDEYRSALLQAQADGQEVLSLLSEGGGNILGYDLEFCPLPEANRNQWFKPGGLRYSAYAVKTVRGNYIEISVEDRATSKTSPVLPRLVARRTDRKRFRSVVGLNEIKEYLMDL